jgi:hypothetical protein
VLASLGTAFHQLPATGDPSSAPSTMAYRPYPFPHLGWQPAPAEPLSSDVPNWLLSQGASPWLGPHPGLATGAPAAHLGADAAMGMHMRFPGYWMAVPNGAGDAVGGAKSAVVSGNGGSSASLDSAVQAATPAGSRATLFSLVAPSQSNAVSKKDVGSDGGVASVAPEAQRGGGLEGSLVAGATRAPSSSPSSPPQGAVGLAPGATPPTSTAPRSSSCNTTVASVQRAVGAPVARGARGGSNGMSAGDALSAGLPPGPTPPDFGSGLAPFPPYLATMMYPPMDGIAGMGMWQPDGSLGMQGVPQLPLMMHNPWGFPSPADGLWRPPPSAVALHSDKNGKGKIAGTGSDSSKTPTVLQLAPAVAAAVVAANVRRKSGSVALNKSATPAGSQAASQAHGSDGSDMDGCSDDDGNKNNMNNSNGKDAAVADDDDDDDEDDDNDNDNDGNDDDDDDDVDEDETFPHRSNGTGSKRRRATARDRDRDRDRPRDRDRDSGSASPSPASLSCAHCSFVARTKPELAKHATSHESSRAFSCRFCDYKAKRSCRLREHELIHSNVKQFACGFAAARIAASLSFTPTKHPQNKQRIQSTSRGVRWVGRPAHKTHSTIPSYCATG